MNIIIPATDERLERNPNGTYWCTVCHCIVILFDDDEHDCIGHDWKDNYT